MRLRPPISTRTDTLVPYTTPFRSSTCADANAFCVNTPATRLPSAISTTRRSLRPGFLIAASATPRRTPATGSRLAGADRLTAIIDFRDAIKKALKRFRAPHYFEKNRTFRPELTTFSRTPLPHRRREQG